MLWQEKPAMDIIKKLSLLADAAKKPLAVKVNSQYDLTVALPASQPDTANTVVVLELAGPVKADNVFYSASNVGETRLLAFDAQLTGKGLQYGDGKTDRYYVEGWKSADQSLNWWFRTTSQIQYKLIIKYLAGPDAGGTVTIDVDGAGQQLTVNNAKKATEVVVEEVGTIVLTPGRHLITLKPISIAGKELMKLLELEMVQL